MKYVRRIEVTVMVDTNKDTHDETFSPDEGESLPELLRRLADDFENERAWWLE